MPSTLAAPLHDTIRDAQRKVVKIYGAGGVRGLEAYQTGILISPEGHVLTALSYVLDTDDLTVVLDDGRQFTAELTRRRPGQRAGRAQAAARGRNAAGIRPGRGRRPAQVGDRVLALSNLYNIAGGDEPVSVLQGVVTAIAPLEARRGGFQSNYHGPVYVLDAAANNPGAAGGALVDWNGRLLGVLGKELKSRATGAWLHYALPIDEIAATVGSPPRGRVARRGRRPAGAAERPVAGRPGPGAGARRAGPHAAVHRRGVSRFARRPRRASARRPRRVRRRRADGVVQGGRRSRSAARKGSTTSASPCSATAS